MQTPFTTAIGVELITELLVVATAVALLSKKIRIPYTVALVLVGLGVGFSHLLHPVGLSTDIILLVFLPPLLFEGVVAMDLPILREKWLEVSLFALPATILSVLALAIPAHFFVGLSWPVSLLLGSILAPTDPVSVLSILRETGVSKRLAHIIDGESCFNDGVGVVLFLIFSKLVAGADVSVGGGIGLFVVEVLGGLAVGAILGTATHLLLLKIDDHLIEVMISVALAYGSYVLGDRLHVSGVMAVVAAGIVIGNWGKAMSMTPTTLLALHHFWEVMAFVANSLLFLLVGIAIESARLGEFAVQIIVLYLALTLGRAATVWGFAKLLGWLGRPMSREWTAVIAWSGLRGSISIALAMGLELPADAGSNREQLLTIVFGVVLLSLLVQGLSLKGLIRRLGLAEKNEVELNFEKLVGQRVAVRAALHRLHELARTGQVPSLFEQELQKSLEARMDALQSAMHSMLEGNEALARGRRDEIVHALVESQRTALAGAAGGGLISNEIFEELARELDVQLDQGHSVAFTELVANPHEAPPAVLGAITLPGQEPAPSADPSPEPAPAEAEKPAEI